MTHSEQQVGSTLTESMLHEIMTPGYLPDISALNVQMDPGYEGPFLEILEQPKSRGFRFRYPCEGPSHGGLPGQFSDTKNKSYPSVQLNNYRGSCRIVVSLVTETEPFMPHAHSLTGKNASSDGVVTVQIGPEQGMTASFPNLGIQHVTKKLVGKTLMQRYSKMQALQSATITALSSNSNGASSLHGLNTLGNPTVTIGSNFDKGLAIAVADEEAGKIGKMVSEQAKTMNLSAIKLCFQAYLPDENGNFTKPLKPCISNTVYDSKAPQSCQLKICKMDKASGCVTGGDEIYLLCDRVQKDDIEVNFFEYDSENSKITWSNLGVFAPSDVHRQFAIVFKTPPYWNVATERPVDVLIELRRKSDQITSEPMHFTYTPQMFDQEQIGAKRRKTIPHFSNYFPDGSPPGAAGGGGAGGLGDPSGGLFVNFGGAFQFGTGFSGTSSTTNQQSQGGGTQHATSTDSQLSQTKLQELAWKLVERSASAMRNYASTGDTRYLLSTQRHLTAVQNDDGDTALHLAVINCQFPAIESLVSVIQGLPEDIINIYNYLRQTPLHLATLTKQSVTTECLLRGNANATLCDRHGNTPLHTACSHGDVGCLKVLINKNLRKETEGLPEINRQNYEGFTPLHIAVIKANREIIRLLLSVGADVEAKDGTCGRSPLHLAVEHNNLAIAGFLILEAKCDVDSYTYDDNTPLHLAAGLGLEGQTALLVAAGADTMATNSEDETPYALASTAEVKAILSDEDVSIDTVNTSSSDPVIKNMADEVNRSVSSRDHQPEISRHVTSSSYGNEKGMLGGNREDSGVGGDSGIESQSVSADGGSDLFLFSSRDKPIHPITQHEPRFQSKPSQQMHWAQ